MGGAEKSLVYLLQSFDYQKYNVDLLLFKREGVLLKYVPKEVRILDMPSYYSCFDGPFLKTFRLGLKQLNVKLIIDRIRFGFLHKNKRINPAVKEQKGWQYIKKHIGKVERKYSAAIGFLEKTPNYYVVDCVSAIKKIGFIRTDYNELGMCPEIDSPYFNKLDYILTNSNNATATLVKNFTEFKNKIYTVQNTFPITEIERLSTERIKKEKADINIVTVGRLAKSKNLSLAIGCCNALKKDGYDILWTVVGEGEDRNNLERQIIELGLQKSFFLIGQKDNPYPYIFAADIFVHPSIFEGKSRVIEEAKILKKYIIVNNFPSAHEQIEHGITGLICDNNIRSFKDAIIKLCSDKTLKNTIKANLEKLNFNTISEIYKYLQ